MDLGMSSMQVDNRERGFAYAYDAPLDMRMDPDQELTAYEIVNTWDRRRIARALREYGEERFADRIAGEIVRRRGRAELDHDLRAQRGDHRRHPRARALRRRPPGQAHVPGDPDRRQRRAHAARRGAPAGLGASPKIGGRIAALTFHSLEDRRVKRFFAEKARGCICPPDLPDLRVRQHAGGGARAPPLDRRHAGRGRGQPPFEVGSPPGRPQALGGALTCPSTQPSPPRRTAPIAPAPGLRPVAPAGAGGAAVRAAAPAPFEQLAGSPTTASSTACCAAARASG